ncbi:hypothetical protein ACFX2H_043614 [Malus domestica]
MMQLLKQIHEVALAGTSQLRFRHRRHQFVDRGLMVVALSDITARQTTGKKMEEIRESCCNWACWRSEREGARILMTREWLKMTVDVRVVWICSWVKSESAARSTLTNSAR